MSGAISTQLQQQEKVLRNQKGKNSTEYAISQWDVNTNEKKKYFSDLKNKDQQQKDRMSFIPKPKIDQ